MTITRRARGLMAIAGALIVLHPSICALACLEASSEGRSPVVADMPCHESAPDPESSDSGQPAPPTDCGCAVAGDAVLWNTELSPSGSADLGDLFGLVVSPRALLLTAVTSFPMRVPPRETDLPPPDILLRKSSLLI